MHKSNGGLSDARNTGLCHVTGDYILFVDSDDYLRIDTCGVLAGVITEYGTEIIVCDEVLISSKRTTYIKNGSLKKNTVMNGREYLKKTMSSGRFKAAIPLNIYNAVFWKKHGFEFKTGIFHEDMQLSPSVFVKAETILYLGQAFYNCTIRSDSITHNEDYRGKRYNDLMVVFAEWKELALTSDDLVLRRAIIGMACKSFINACARNTVSQPDFSVVSKRDLLCHALSYKEWCKAALFLTNRTFYYMVWNVVNDMGLVK